MCGRFSLTTTPEAMRTLRGYDERPNLRPRYNIAPTQPVAVVRAAADGGRELAFLRWGLVPHWAGDATQAARMINARAETVADKPAFRDAFRRRRCLVPADGFYEWRAEEGGQPFRIGMKGGGVFAFAGLWDRWRATIDVASFGLARGAQLESVTIVTTAANEKLAPIHQRMPVILDPADHAAWLDVDGCSTESARRLLRPYPAGPMAFYRVSRQVNSVRNDDAACVAPLRPASAAA